MIKFNFKDALIFFSLPFQQIDRSITKNELQLVGITAMFISCKYEEIYLPEIGDFAYITDKTFSKADIRKMEVRMLKTLDFYVSFPLPLHFLRRNSKAGQVITPNAGFLFNIRKKFKNEEKGKLIHLNNWLEGNRKLIS